MNTEILVNIIGWTLLALMFAGLYYPIYAMKKWIKELDELVKNGNKWPDEETRNK